MISCINWKIPPAKPVSLLVAFIFLLLSGNCSTVEHSSVTNERTRNLKTDRIGKISEALQKLDAQIEKKIERYFRKTCEVFQKKGYEFQVHLNYDNNKIWRSVIEPGDGVPSPDEDWFFCPIKLADILVKSSIKMYIKVHYSPPPDLFSTSSQWIKIRFEGSSIKANNSAENFSVKSHYLSAWEISGNKIKVYVPALAQGPDVMKVFNGSHDFKIENNYLKIKIGKNTLKQIEATKIGKGFGVYEATVHGWFGNSFNKYIRDRVKNCSTDVNGQIKKLSQSIIDYYGDKDIVADNPSVAGYLRLAEEAGKKLCNAMKKVNKIFELQDIAKFSEINEIKNGLEKDLKEVKKGFRTDLSSYIKQLK